MIAIGNVYFVVVNVNKREKNRGGIKSFITFFPQFEAIIENGLNHVYQVKRQLLVTCYATLHPALSVRLTVRPSVCHTLLFWVLGFLAKKITKNDHFRRFPFLPRRFKWSYLSHFLEIWPEIFFGTSKHLILAK